MIYFGRKSQGTRERLRRNLPQRPIENFGIRFQAVREPPRTNNRGGFKEVSSPFLSPPPPRGDPSQVKVRLFLLLARCGHVRMGLGVSDGDPWCGKREGRGSEHREEKTDWNENFEYLQLGLGISRATRSNLLENIDEIPRRAGFRTFSRKNESGCMRPGKIPARVSEVNAKVSLNIEIRARE